MKMILTVFGLCVLVQVTTSSNVPLKYSSVASHVIQASNSDVIPILANEDGPLKVTLSLSFVSILEVDVERDQVDVLFWLYLSWRNKALAWNMKDKGFNTTSVTIPDYYLWLPDMTISNAATRPKIISPEKAVVYNDGLVYWVPSVSQRVLCNLQGVDSDQGANCTMKFISWAYSGSFLSIADESSSNLHEYVAHPSYEILATSHMKHSINYTCCPGAPYEDFSFEFVIRSTNQKQA